MRELHKSMHFLCVCLCANQTTLMTSITVKCFKENDDKKKRHVFCVSFRVFSCIRFAFGMKFQLIIHMSLRPLILQRNSLHFLFAIFPANVEFNMD